MCIIAHGIQRRGESMIPMESMESMREGLEDFIDKTTFELDLKNKLLEVQFIYTKLHPFKV